MSQLKKIAELENLEVYKKDLKAELARLKDQPVLMHWIELFKFRGGKKSAVIILGPLNADLKEELKSAGKALKAGKCQRNEKGEVEIVGGLKPGLVAALFKTLALTEKVCETVGPLGEGISDETAEAVGQMVERAEQEAEVQNQQKERVRQVGQQGATGAADKAQQVAREKVEAVYSALRRKINDALGRVDLPAPKKTLEELLTSLTRDYEAGDFVALQQRLPKAAATFSQVEKSLQKQEEDQQAAEAASRQADALTAQYEAVQKKLGPIYDEAKRLKLSTDELIEAEREIEKALKQPSGIIVAQLESIKKMILEYAQLGKKMAEANAARQQEIEEEARKLEEARKQEEARQEEERKQLEAEALRKLEEKRRQDEEDEKLLRGTAKKKKGGQTPPSPTDSPQRAPKGKKKFVKLDVGTMTFKEKFQAGMVKQVGGVQKKVTGFDKNGGFSTFYLFSQGDSNDPAYEIHIHRRANGRYLSGQVKFGHLAKVVRGGEEPISATELATYGIPAVETWP